MNCQMSGRLVSVEGRKQTAVTHLAFARRLNCRNRHFGQYTKDKIYISTKDKEAALISSFFFINYRKIGKRKKYEF